jgi:aldehyde:ferredoxin oxidoreductase
MIELFGDKNFGFSGKIVNIDLSLRKISEEPINNEFINLFFGGAGYACRYLFDHI